MKKPLLLSSLLLAAAALLLSAGSAFAQETAPPPATPVTAPPPPSAGGQGAGIGIGAAVWLNGFAGGQFVYDQSMFHIEGTLGYRHTSPSMGMGDSAFLIGAGGWYHLFRGINSDFSLGGEIGLNYASAGPGSTTYSIEPGAEARVFLTPNFALEAKVGISFQFGDNNQDTIVGIGGQPSSGAGGPATTAGFGFTYFIR